MYLSASLQDKYLSELIREKQPVVIYTTHGQKHEGTILSVTHDLIFMCTPEFRTVCRKEVKTILPRYSK